MGRRPRSDESTGKEQKMKKLYRSTENKKIAGIFGGLGEIFNIDPTLLRLIFVFIGLVTAVIPLVLAYLVGWIIIPKGKGSSEGAK
jgi:phage shock protein C